MKALNGAHRCLNTDGVYDKHKPNDDSFAQLRFADWQSHTNLDLGIMYSNLDRNEIQRK